jgi:hypothetical protein
MDPRQWNCSQVIQWLSSFNKNQHVLDIFASKWYRCLHKIVRYVSKADHTMHFSNYLDTYSSLTMDNQTLKFSVNLNHYMGIYIPLLPVIKLTFIEITETFFIMIYVNKECTLIRTLIIVKHYHRQVEINNETLIHAHGEKNSIIRRKN